MFEFIFAAWRLRKKRAERKYECCRKARNLTRQESGRADVHLEVCICGRRHFYVQAERGRIGATGSTIGVLLLLLSVPSIASAQASEPWIAYAQTAPVCQGGINNPVTNLNGLIGEVTLPYTVPDGKELVIEAYGLEAYGNVPGGLVLAPYIGATPPTTNAVFLHSVFSDNATNEAIGVEFHLPAGKVFNVRLMSNECPAQVVGWYVKGHLVSQ